MKKVSLAVLGILLVAVGVVAWSGLFVVRQTEQALVLQFGAPVRAESEPGLKFKLPFVQNVEYYERRILDLDPPAQEVILQDQKRVNVDSFARFKIVNPLEFRKKAQTAVNFRQIFGNRLNATVRSEVGQVLLPVLLSEKRADIMDRITKQMKEQAEEFGVEVIDVRIGRTDLPEATSQSVYNRMRSDRTAYAAEIRAEGERQKLRIEANADRERTIILAEANKKAKILRGEGEGERTRLLNAAFGKDPEFFDLYRSLEAYGVAFDDGTTMVMSPDSDFFRYFNTPKEFGKR